MLRRSVLLCCAGVVPPRSPDDALILVKGLHRHDLQFTVVWPPAAPAVEPPSQPTLGLHIAADGPGAPSPSASPSAPREAEAEGGYVSVPRSPFSVLRGRRTLAGRCGAGLLSLGQAAASVGPSGCCGGVAAADGGPWCCCAALIYRSPAAAVAGAEGVAAAGGCGVDAEAECQRDAFVLGLKMSGCESTLRAVVGDATYHDLIGNVAVAEGRPRALCADFTPALRSVESGGVGGLPAGSRQWVARTLLSADEENRLKWLWEETGDLSRCYSRAPTLRALFVMWSIVSARSTAAVDDAAPARPLSVADIDQVHQRMVGHGVEITLGDVGALIAFAAAADLQVQDFVVGLILRLLTPETIATLVERRGTLRTDLEVVMLLTSLCRYAGQCRREAADGEGATTAEAAATATATASSVKRAVDDGGGSSLSETLRRSSSSGSGSSSGASAAEEHRVVAMVRIATRIKEAHAAALRQAGDKGAGKKKSGSCGGTSGGHGASRQPHGRVSARLIEHFVQETCAVVSSCQLSDTSPYLDEVTVWLLREMPRSPACYRHFRQVADHGPSEALQMLFRSGVLSRRLVDLDTVNRTVVPLLEHCNNEDFFTLVMRDVIGLLEDRLRRDPHSFTEQDMQRIADLGTRLFAMAPEGGGGGALGGFDGAAREQMEELHVMDGSPWALCVSSYRSLKEIVQNLVRDQRKLKRQVQEQMRNIGLAAGVKGPGTVVTAEEAPAGTATPLGGAASAGPEAAGAAPTAAADAPSSSTSSTTTATPSPSAEPPQQRPPAAEPTDAPERAAVKEKDEAGAPSRMMVSPVVRQRFLLFVEDLVKALVDDNTLHSERPIVVSSALFEFVNRHVPVPNIQDEYRRKIFLLVNVAEDPATIRARRRERRERRRIDRERAAMAAAGRDPDEASRHGALVLSRLRGGRSGRSVDDDVDEDEEDEDGDKEGVLGGLFGGETEEIPAELRFLVSSLPLTLSPWASVMILREVLAESAGRNPRYTYVLNAAIDLQLPISTTRSRIATTLNMWRFLNSQSHKLSLRESVVIKQRCVLNLPMSYILSSYWSLLTSLVVAGIIALSVVGLDFESQLVANSLFQKFTPWEEVTGIPFDPWNSEAAVDLASDYFGQDEIASRNHGAARRSTDVFLSSASYLFLGYDDQRRPMTVIPISSDAALGEGERVAEEFAGAAAVLRELSLHAPFPFYLDIERPMSTEYIETRIAERIRRVSFNNTWFLPRMIIRTFPLGRRYTERMLITHTCAQANLTRRRITFIIYIEDGVPVTATLLRGLHESFISQSANLVLVVHERSLVKGGTTPSAMEQLTRSLRAATADTDGDGAEGGGGGGSDAEGDGVPLRVLPYSRQLHDIPAGVRASATAPRAVLDGRAFSAAVRGLSPYARRYGLGLTDATMGGDDDTVGSRGGGGVLPEWLWGAGVAAAVARRVEGGAVMTALHETIDVAVGLSVAAAQVAVAPVGLSVRGVKHLWRAAEDILRRGEGDEDPEEVVVVKGEEEAEVPSTAPPGEGGDNSSNSSGIAVGSAHEAPRVVSVPFSMVKTAMERTTSTGLTAMQWLSDDAARPPHNGTGKTEAAIA